MVDVGAYTERGEWVDGFLHMGQIKDDGGYVAQAPRSRLKSEEIWKCGACQDSSKSWFFSVGEVSEDF